MNDTQSFETYSPLGNYEISRLKSAEPSCFNGIVCVVKYKVTIEAVQEPAEVIGARLQKLWDECDNHYHWNHLKRSAAKHGYTLIGNSGSKRKPR